jgi:phosphatidate cytidylyltransferase
VLRWRAVTALVLAPIALGAILIGEAAVLALVLVVVAGAAYELSRALKPLPFVAAFGAGAIPILLSIPLQQTGILAGAVAGLPWALLWLAGRPETRTLRAVLAVLLMALWVGVPLAHLSLYPGSRNDVFVLTMIAVVGPWISDSGGYFAGRFFGRHPPSRPSARRRRSRASSAACSYGPRGRALRRHLPGYPVSKALVMSLGVSLASQGGDLFESVLKRILDVKDLGHFLPGHGGLLDRIDSLLFTVPAVYYISLLA